MIIRGDYHRAVAQKIMGSFENRSRLTDLGKNSKETIEHGFRIERMINDYANLYSKQMN